MNDARAQSLGRFVRYLAAFGVGILTAIATAFLWIVVRFVLPIAVPVLLSRIGGSGVGAAGAVISSGSILVAALLGFVGGAAWTLSRR